LSQKELQCGKYKYMFTASGFFTLANKADEPLYDQALPLFEKAMSHLIWTFCWISLILASYLFLPRVWLYYTDRFLMALIFVHLFFFGCRLTSLLLKGGIKPILLPPLWVRITRQLQKGKGLELLAKHHLEKHPGLLANLALIQYGKSDYAAAKHTLSQALLYSPNHPILLELQQALIKLDS
jgi:tetratricopeptide (TPR) repeat protein